MSYRIFIVEDDAKIAGSVSGFLERYGFQTVLAADFRQVEQECLAANPHLVIMDVNLPYQDGFHLCRAIRRHSAVPILFLSARAGEMEQVMGMESGGDDYITKPFHLDVLHAKVRAMLRRAWGEYAQPDGARAVLRAGALELDLAAAEMRYAGQSQSLTKTELKLLHILIERADRVVSREDCLEALWDDSSFVDDNTLTVNVTRLRSKLDAWGLKEAVETRRGLGYQLITAKLENRP